MSYSPKCLYRINQMPNTSSSLQPVSDISSSIRTQTRGCIAAPPSAGRGFPVGGVRGASPVTRRAPFCRTRFCKFSHFLFLFFLHYHSPGRACCLFVHFSAVGVFAGCAFFFSFSFPFKMASSSWQTRLVTVYSSFLILAGIFVFISRLGGDFAPFAASSPQPLEPASPRLTLNVVLSSNSLPSSSLTCGDGTHVEERKAWQAAHAKYAGLRDDKFTSVKDRHPSG